MRCLAPCSENEMVLAFVRAEFDSPRFGPMIRFVLAGDARLVNEPDLADLAENVIRRQALVAVRGYGRDDMLFRGFPSEVEWSRLAFTVSEVGELLYANYPTWVKLSGGSRRVRDGAANIGLVDVDEDINEHVPAVERALTGGSECPELILVAESQESDHVILEGHTRATAYVRALPPDAEVEVIAGYAPEMSAWQFR